MRHFPNIRSMLLATPMFTMDFRRLSTTALIALSSIGAQAQTCFYLDQINVAPASPTTADAITITVSGDLSSTAAFIGGTSFGINGNTVQLTVNAAAQGIGLDVLVPHSESIPIGDLAAGIYTILINGTAIVDMAPSPQHQFVVSGGTVTDCDSLELISARWSVFSSEQIMLTVANGSSDLFDYPGFVLLDSEGDTLAKETVYYFGISQGPQQHSLEIMPGVVIDGNTANGELYLWSGFYTEQECEWPVSWDLCPEQECTTVMPYLWNLGDALITVAVPYTLENEDGLELAAGTFVLDIDNQNAYGQEVCLPPGNYTLHLDQVGFVGGQLYYGMTTSMVNNEQVQEPYVQGTAVNDKGFVVFEPCIDASNGMPAHVNGPGLDLTMDGDRWIIGASDKSRIGMFQLLDPQGRILRTGTFNGDRGELDLSGLGHGAYYFRSERLGSVRLIH